MLSPAPVSHCPLVWVRWQRASVRVNRAWRHAKIGFLITRPGDLEKALAENVVIANALLIPGQVNFTAGSALYGNPIDFLATMPSRNRGGITATYATALPAGR